MVERLSAALYFARSPIYQTTLQLFGLPEHLLPEGVDLSAFRRPEKMDNHYELDPWRRETAVGASRGLPVGWPCVQWQGQTVWRAQVVRRHTLLRRPAPRERPR